MKRRDLLKGLLIAPNTLISKNKTEKKSLILKEVEAKDKLYAQREFEIALEQANLYREASIQNSWKGDDVLPLEKRLELLPPHVFDNHEIHIHEHGKWLLANYCELYATGDRFYILVANSCFNHYKGHDRDFLESELAQGIMRKAEIRTKL